jgi:hypothetical protein
MPRLKIPNAPIKRAVFCRFAGDTKRGLSAVTTTHRTTSSRKVASSFFIGRQLYPSSRDSPVSHCALQ